MSPRVAVGGALLLVAVSAAAWSLAYPQGVFVPALVRALADCAAVAAVGLAVVPALDDGRHREELAARARPALAIAGAVWLVAELLRQLVTAMQAAAESLARVPMSTVLEFTMHTHAGRAGLTSIVAAAAVCLLALGGPPSTPVAIVLSGVAAAGVAARAVSGHLADDPLGAGAVAVHALAAAVWCGALVALVLTVDHRAQWARVLPRFSQLSLVCVAALLASGAVGALLVIPSASALYASGYGRLLVAKIFAAAVLVVLGWHNRSSWLPAARAHRVSAKLSRRRSLVELAIMLTALTLAATLVVTG